MQDWGLDKVPLSNSRSFIGRSGPRAAILCHYILRSRRILNSVLVGYIRFAFRRLRLRLRLRFRVYLWEREGVVDGETHLHLGTSYRSREFLT